MQQVFFISRIRSGPINSTRLGESGLHEKDLRQINYSALTRVLSRRPVLFNVAAMITTNMPQLVQHLRMLGDVRVLDRNDSIVLHVEKPVNIEHVDDLVCDALFADPLLREEAEDHWTIKLYKRDGLRHAGDMRVIPNGDASRYEVQYDA